MPLQKFAPPGFVDDLTETQKDAWSDKINRWIEKERTKLGAPYDRFFFNELQHPEADGGVVATITWEGFPRFWKLEFPGEPQKRWEASEKLYKVDGVICRYQDEYLEWHSYKSEGKLTKVTFSCEGPEYWEHIAEVDPDKLLELYRYFVGPLVQSADLFTSTPEGSVYNPSNKWNLAEGIVHLTHPANTLSAEINLAAGATLLRRKGTVDPVIDTHDLICCSGFGVESRSSDPTIGAGVNSFVRKGDSVTLNNPIGLYIHKINTSGIEVPDGLAVRDFWKVIRGDKDRGMILRAEFAVPAGANITLEDVKIGGSPLRFGAQLAEIIDMVIYGKTFKIEQDLPPSKACGDFCGDAATASEAAHAGHENFKATARQKPGLRVTSSKPEEV